MNILTFSALPWMFCLAGAQIATGADDLAAHEEEMVRASVSRVTDSVVKIIPLGAGDTSGGRAATRAATTGVIVSHDGYIVSSAFAFTPRPASIVVVGADGHQWASELVATDQSRKIVLLKVRADQPLVVPDAVAETEIQVGAWAIALGRASDSDEASVSVGIVSATGRMFGRAIQTDAKVSPTNYGGPLVDIRGRVLGILVPLSPQGGNEQAGLEWYDSGIGFAIPLAHIQRVLDRMKAGEDLDSGILGVSLEPGNPFVQAPAIAAVPPQSPAYKAGLRPGDRIAALDGRDVHTQMQLRLDLGPRYAGETVRVVALRGDERIERDLTLVDKLAPFEHAFLGVLPERSSAPSAQGGLRIRFVYPGSPADQGGLRVGDEIVTCGEQPVSSRDDALRVLNTLSPGDTLRVVFRRGQPSQQADVTLDRMPISTPSQIPPALSPVALEDPPPPQRGAAELKIAEYKNSCTLYVPESASDGPALGVLVWLGAPGDPDAQKKLDPWRPLCDQYGLIFVAPSPADPAQWSAAEVDYVHKVLHKVTEDYSVDRARIVLHGEREGGTLAYWVAMQARELVRAVAVIDAPLPGRGTVPENDPLLRLAVYAATARQARWFPKIEDSLEALQAARYPVTKVDLGEESRYLDDRELAELARWIDTLDRI